MQINVIQWGMKRMVTCCSICLFNTNSYMKTRHLRFILTNIPKIWESKQGKANKSGQRSKVWSLHNGHSRPAPRRKFVTNMLQYFLELISLCDKWIFIQLTHYKLQSFFSRWHLFIGFCSFMLMTSFHFHFHCSLSFMPSWNSSLLFWKLVVFLYILLSWQFSRPEQAL